jgi:transcriptional regulator with XRE-family HTH domain
MDPSGVERLRQRLSGAKDEDASKLFQEIAAQVSERRKAWGLSQNDLADLCGTTQSAIARLEAGRRPPRIDTLRRVATALDCDLRIELQPKTKGSPR